MYLFTHLSCICSCVFSCSFSHSPAQSSPAQSSPVMSRSVLLSPAQLSPAELSSAQLSRVQSSSVQFSPAQSCPTQSSLMGGGDGRWVAGNTILNRTVTYHIRTCSYAGSRLGQRSKRCKIFDDPHSRSKPLPCFEHI